MSERSVGCLFGTAERELGQGSVPAQFSVHFYYLVAADKKIFRGRSFVSRNSIVILLATLVSCAADNAHVPVCSYPRPGHHRRTAGLCQRSFLHHRRLHSAAHQGDC